MNFSNPYIAGNPVHGQEKFIGRLDVLQDVLRTLRHPGEKAIVLFGQRRIGKTSVLLHLEQQLRLEDLYVPVYFDLQNKASLPLDDVLYQMAQKISAVTKTVLPDREQFDREGKFFQDIFMPAAVGTINSEELVLLLDEFDVLDLPQREQAGKTFFPYLQKWMKNARGIQFVFVLGRRPEELSTDTLATFKGIRSRKVSLMMQRACETIIRQSEKTGSLAWSNDAVARVWHWTQGHPYLTQLLCSEVWETLTALNANEKPPENGESDDSRHLPFVHAEHVDAALDKTLEHGANAFQWIWNGLPPAERVVMAAMAELRDEHITLDDLTDVLQHSKVRMILRELQLAPETLTRWDLLCPVNGYYRFAVPLLRRWVAAEKPLRRVKTELDSLEPLAESLYRSGEGFYKMGNLQEAERLLHNALNVNPNHFRARLLLGQVLLGEGNAAVAVDILEPAYAFDPRSAQPGLISALLALAESQNGKDQLVTYNRILEIDAEQVTALKKKRKILLGIAKAAVKKGNFDTALKLFRHLGDQDGVTSVQLGQKKITQQLRIARQHEQQEDWATAIAVYTRLLKEFPERKDWQERLHAAQTQKKLDDAYAQAFVAMEQGKHKLAKTLLSRIVGIQADYKEALRYLLLVVTGIDLERLLTEHRLASAYQRYEDLGNGIMLELMAIPGGVFMMGSPDDEKGRLTREGPRHHVTVSPFYLSKYLVTQAQWDCVMDINPSYFSGPTRPVENISWHDAVEFCQRLSRKTGRHYRLPSEAEWEYACRARTTTPFHFGNVLTADLANYDATQTDMNGPIGEYRGETMDVGSFPPNGFGLYDMHGNLWEWCADAWHEDYRHAPSDGRAWQDGDDARCRVLRGGAWDILPQGCRSAFRNSDNADHHEPGYGFRLVCEGARA